MTFRMSGSNATLAVLATISMVGAWSAPARASETYPGVIKTYLKLDKPPPCTICHQTDPGQKGNATQSFALMLKDLNLVQQSPNTLRAILPKAEAEGLDGDGDGVSDFEELRAGRNPSIWDPSADGDGGTEAPPSRPPVPPVLKTGCSAQGHRPASHDGAAAATILVALSAMQRRARRRRTS